MTPKPPPCQPHSIVMMGVNDWLHHDIDLVFIKWRTRWVKKEIAETFLNSLIEQLWVMPPRNGELKSVLSVLRNESGKLPTVEPMEKPKNELPAPDVMIEKAHRQKEAVAQQFERHPLKKLASYSKSALRNGCRGAIEEIVGYPADQRRKQGPAQLVGESKKKWVMLFVGFKRRLKKWWVQDPRKQRITNLVEALTGGNDGCLGLIQLVEQFYFQPGSSVRIAMVDAQARLKADGTEYPRPIQNSRNGHGLTRSILVATARISLTEAKEATSDDIAFASHMAAERQRIHRDRTAKRQTQVT